tara:strand:- start:925 stop:1155 length:231 start_codon:yes stop_codon:yes gene_type:complete
MKVILAGFLFAAITLPIDVDKLKADLSDMERDALALELYLQDKQDHEDYCPQISWDQPSLNTYKETLRSHLPEGCK